MQEAWSLTTGTQEKTVSLRYFCTFTYLINTSCGTEPLVHHGRHFGRTLHAFCSVNTLLNNGILRTGELLEKPEDMFMHEFVVFLGLLQCIANAACAREWREHRIFQALLLMVLGLEERLMQSSNEAVIHIAELVCVYICQCNFIH